VNLGASEGQVVSAPLVGPMSCYSNYKPGDNKWRVGDRVIMFNATFNNTSFISLTTNVIQLIVIYGVQCRILYT